MANTYTQIYIHAVFAVQGRHSLIPKAHLEELYKYITGILRHRHQKLLAIGGMPDHVHLFIGMKPSVALSDLMRDVKAGSSKFINEKRWVPGKFRWQEGFGAFSYARSQIDRVCRCGLQTGDPCGAKSPLHLPLHVRLVLCMNNLTTRFPTASCCWPF